jgi:outer membrane murein-binding lipoprotein Lpp
LNKINQTASDLKSKNDKQKKLISSLKKIKKLIKDKDKEIMRLKGENTKIVEDYSKTNSDLLKKLKDKESEVQRLKSELERLKNKVNSQNNVRNNPEKSKAARPKSNPSPLEETVTEKRIIKKTSDKPKSDNSEKIEKVKKEISKHSSPKNIEIK